MEVVDSTVQTPEQARESLRERLKPGKGIALSIGYFPDDCNEEPVVHGEVRGGVFLGFVSTEADELSLEIECEDGSTRTVPHNQTLSLSYVL